VALAIGSRRLHLIGSMRRTAAIMLACACSWLAACSSGPSTVLESDVPIPPGMEALTTADVDRTDGVLTRVRVVCRGDLRSISTTADRMRDAFALQGWTCTAIDARSETATMTFAKGERIATVDVHINRIDPKMGAAVLRVRPSGAAPVEPAATQVQ
jgi:hypothetical protein